jgi:TonB family protein
MHVHDVLHDAWKQPGEALNWDPRLLTVVVIRVARDGKIVAVRMKSGSGNRTMDQSVMEACDSVSKLDPLPDGLGDAYKDIPVSFQLKG